MNLNTMQQQLLQETLESLIGYANSRLGTVRPARGELSDEDRMLRAGIVARALWQHVEIIDDYARENPDHLSLSHIEVARGLGGVLYDDLIFEGVQHGRAIFLHETGTYHAVGFNESSLGKLPDRPTCMRATLAPFQGLIVLLAPLVGTGLPSDDLCVRLRASASRAGAISPTSDGDVLASRARTFQQVRKQRTHAARHQPQARRCGEGFHQGVLAGLTGRRRQAAVDAHYDLVAHESGAFQQSMAARSVDAHLFPITLVEGLQLLDDDWLESIAERFGCYDCDRSVPREQLVAQLAEHLANDRDQRDNALTWCEDAQFKLVRKLLRDNPISLNQVSPSEATSLYPMIPYVFILQENDSFVAWMPPEIRRLISEVDLDAIMHVRARLSQVARAADALASMCGVIGIEAAHKRYKAVADAPLDLRQFTLALLELQTCDTRDSFALWNHGTDTYLVSAEIADDSAIAHVARSYYADRIRHYEGFAESDAPSYMEIDGDDEETFEKRLDEEFERLEERRISLLAHHSDRLSHGLDAKMLTCRYVDYLLETEPLRRIRAYVDDHVPDDQDDCEFPTTFARSVVVSILFEREPYDDVLDLVRLFGMTACEGEGFPHTLGRLLTCAYNALPRWELNGWSLEENTERLTGRTRRYRDDGTLIEEP